MCFLWLTWETMKCLRLFVIIGLSVILVASPQALAQKTKAPAKKSEAKLEAERIRKEQQVQARSLLVSLASDARSFRDQSLRARSLARIAANSTEGFTGEGGMVTQTMNSRGVISIRPQPVPDFDIEELFAASAGEDYERAVQLARGFQGEAARANATIAIARSVLNDKGARVRTP